MQTATKTLPMVKSLSLSEKAAQMIMIDFSGTDPDRETIDHIKSLNFGGFILFSKNVKNRNQLTKLNRQLSEIYPGGIPPYISVDQEGGLVNRMTFEGMHTAPSQMALGFAGDETLVEETAFISGVELRELGFHLNYAPLVDVNCNPENPIIGSRSFGEDPKTVSRLGSAAVRGYNRAGIGCCAKHFPGHGNTTVDSHLGLPVVDASEERIRTTELPPFEAVIKENVPALMTAHVHYKALEPRYPLPATLSRRILHDLLQEEMKFNGLVITDSMLMNAISRHFGDEGAPVMAVNAGAHIIMMCGSPENQIKAHRAIADAVRKGEIPEETLDRAVERIFAFKKRFVTDPPPIPAVSTEDRIRPADAAHRAGIRIIWDRRNLIPIKTEGKKILIATPSKVYRHGLFEEAGSQSLYHHIKNRDAQQVRLIAYDSDKPHAGPIADAMENPDLVIIEVYHMGSPDPAVRRMVDEIIDNGIFKDKPILLVAMASPYGISPNATAAVTAFNCSAPSVKALAERIFA